MSKPAAPRKVGDKEALAVGTTIRGSACKLNLVAGLIRGRKVEEALNILKFSPKGMAEELWVGGHTGSAWPVESARVSRVIPAGAATPAPSRNGPPDRART